MMNAIGGHGPRFHTDVRAASWARFQLQSRVEIGEQLNRGYRCSPSPFQGIQSEIAGREFPSPSLLLDEDK